MSEVVKLKTVFLYFIEAQGLYFKVPLYNRKYKIVIIGEYILERKEVEVGTLKYFPQYALVYRSNPESFTFLTQFPFQGSKK